MNDWGWLAIAAIALSISAATCKAFNINLFAGNPTVTVNIPTDGIDWEEGARVDSLPVCDVVDGSVYDGDTLRVNCNGQIKKIRFACIDAPEKKQEMGIESRDFLRSLLASGNNRVKVDFMGSATYGREVAELWVNRGLDWELVQSLQAMNGMVWGYEQYKRDCRNWDAIVSTQNRAISQSLGVHGLPNSIPPWEWRRKQK